MARRKAYAEEPEPVAAEPPIREAIPKPKSEGREIRRILRELVALRDSGNRDKMNSRLDQYNEEFAK